MRKVVLGLGCSLDGYIARKDGGVDWLSMDWDYDWTKFFGTIDTVLMGRKTLEKTIELMPSEGAPSNPYKGTKAYVFSRTLTESPAEDIELYSGSLAELIRDLKSREGKDIWLAGGGELARSFFEEDLVDQVYLGLTPHLLGSGIPLFPEMLREIPLRLVSCNICKHTKEDNAMLELLYEVKR